MHPPFKPVLLERKILAKVWGGRALEQLFGLELPGSEAVGETWELYDRPDGSSRLRGSDATLRDLMEQDRTALLGHGVRAGHGGRFPLLIKYVDARQALSVQVHPDDEAAAAAQDGGKNEAWIVLQAGPRARIVRGLRPGVGREAFARAAATPEVEGMLFSFRPEAGDCVHVPAGTVHSLGPDVVVFEVQQNSDLTWRLYDWGRPREVHVEQALRAVRFGQPQPAGARPVVAPRPIGPGCERVIDTPDFRVRRLLIEGQTTLPVEGTFKVLNVLGGRGVLGWHSGGEDAPLPLQPGDTALVPACSGQVFLSPIGRLRILWTDQGGPA